MAFHPGVKSLIDRVLKQQPTNDKNKNGTKIVNDLKTNPHDKKLLNQKLTQNNVNKYSVFKDILKDRMKDRRRRLREEEEEEDKLDEEYHILNEDDEATKSSKDETDKENLDENEEEEEDNDDDEDEENEANDDENKTCSDDDFKLNLDDDDDDDVNLDNDKEKKSKNKKSKSKKSENDNDDDDNDLFDCDDILNYKNKIRNEQTNDIPLTIPSNQLTSNSSIVIKKCKNNNNNVYDFDGDNDFDNDTTTQTPFRLYIDSTDQNKQKEEEERIDEIECISLNFDNVNNSLNNQNAADLSLNTANNTTPTSNNKLNFSENNDLFETEVDGEDLDELAMLCSGNFKSIEPKKPTSNDLEFKSPKIDEIKVDEKEKPVVDESSNEAFESIKSSLSKNHVDEVEPKISKFFKIPSEEKQKKKVKSKYKYKDDDDDDGKLKITDDVEDLYDNGDAEDDLEKEKVDDDNEDDNGYVADARRAFFENEAELSGSEADSDENFDGESDDEIVCSGDEDELPSNSELRAELEKIYLKDQIDEDKRKLRMYKELLLADGELHDEKGRRKKQFRWKSLNDNRFANNRFSSDEDEEDNEEEEEEKEIDKGENKEKGLKYENSKLFKTLTTNWRKNRHEREQFVNSKRNRDELLCSDDDESKDSSEFNSQKAQFLKLGQNLLKSNFKRTFEQTASTTVTKTTTEVDGNEDLIITSESLVTKTTTNSSQTAKNQQEKKLYLEKFSFLKKDKTYLSRISSYVNKTLNLTNGLSSAKSDPKKLKNMVFARLTQESTEDTNRNGAEEKEIKEEKPILKPISVQEPAAKRAKIEKLSNNTESIFNHL